MMPGYAEGKLLDLVQRYQDAFNKNDAPRMAKLFTEDTIFVNFSGKIVRGRSSLHRAQEAVFSSGGPLENVQVRYHVESISKVTNSVALVHARQNTILESGFPEEQGKDRMHSILVLLAVLENGEWLVKAGQNTPVATT